ncbi:MAG: ECF-type sigma factor [Planctomycetota bacterium]
MSDVTRILEAIDEGDASASAELLPLVYDELRRLAGSLMARESPAHTLSATALVHEAYMRLIGSEASLDWNSRGHFFGAASKAMRRILIESARARGRQKRSGGRQRVELHESQFGNEELDDEILAVHESLERLAQVDAESAQIVELRYFGGLTAAEAAQVLGISKATADRNWAYARAWLKRDIEDEA